MCTLSVVGHSREAGAVAGLPRLRVVFNRDERRTRLGSADPAEFRAGERRVLAPMDLRSGGTWIAVNDAGLIGALLNATPIGSARGGNHETGAATAAFADSRGSVLPRVLGAATLADALDSALSLECHRLAPFRLWLSDGDRSVLMGSDGRGMEVLSSGALEAPMMLTSSSLGDGIVLGPREAAFARCFSLGVTPLEAQTMFHQWREPGAEELGVLMCRADARTLSRTIVDMYAGRDGAAGRGVMRYLRFDDEMNAIGAEFAVSLAFRCEAVGTRGES